MRIAIGGASGFIGSHLTECLTELNHQIIPLGRGLLREDSFERLVETLEDCDAIINLAGASINRPWTPKYKQKLLNSRIGPTSRLVNAVQVARKKPKVMISASAVGYYPSEGTYDERDEVTTEGFLASLCRTWEAEAKNMPLETRLVITRFGMVLALDGGAMQEMISPILHMKFSAVLGSGRQALPWIAIQDICRAIIFLIENEAASGVYNLVSPQLITQKHLAETLAKSFHVGRIFHVPSFFFRLFFGERSSVMLEGQTVLPTRLLEAGFKFSVPTVEELLSAEVRTTKL